MLHSESDGAGDHFERLSVIVSELLHSGGVAATALKYIRVGVGPGSFTGLRIALSFVKGMSMAAQVPLFGVCSFLGLAHSVAARLRLAGQQILVVADARREEVFWAQYRCSPEGVVTQADEPCIRSLSQVLEWRARYPHGVVCTPNLQFDALGVDSLQVESRIAEGLLLLAEGPAEPFSTLRVSELEPNYLRAVAASRLKSARDLDTIVLLS